IIDPLYLCFPGANPLSMFDMGPRLRAVSDACLRAGATPLLVHHTTEDVRPGKVPELADLAFAGIKQFARQWLLVNRRLPYRPERPGDHRLWLVAGGSAGQSLLLAVDINEGRLEDGRVWDVTLPTPEEARQADQLARQERRTATRHATGQRT